MVVRLKNASNYSIRQPSASVAGRYQSGARLKPRLPRNLMRFSAVGGGRTSILVAALVDTNILVYRFDSTAPRKQALATDLLGQGILEDSLRIPHQAIVEFVAAVTRPRRNGRPLMSKLDASLEAEQLLDQFVVLYPNESLVRTALRGMAAYQLPWFDAQMWAYAEHYGLSDLYSEDFEHDRLYGTVRVVNPFIELLL